VEDDMEYWNPYIETLPKEELEKIELSYFRNILSYAKIHSMMYREKLKGVEAKDIASFEDIRRIPLTDKEELRRYQEMEPYPYGGILGVDIRDVTTFRQSSGTTGKPVYVPESYESWQWRIETWCHILYMTGFRPRHRVFLPFGYNVYVAFWEAHYAAEKVGCELVPGGALDTKGRIYKIIETRANAMMNTPTYGLHIAEEARNMGIDPKSLGIERMLCAGEPMPEATRKRLEELYHCHVFDHIGGTEPCAWGSMCEAKQGLHIIEPFFLVEVLDRETLQKEVGEGQMGVAVVTPLGRRSFPLIRFNTQDVVMKGKGGCSCGRTWKKIKEVVGRADDLRKIRGVLFSPKTVEELIREEFQEIVEYEMMVERKGIMDEVNIRIEIDPSAESKGKEIEKRLKEKLKIRTNLSFQTKIEPLGTLPRYTLKAKRFKDRREL
jgi:phenylacetate-CoA ligase